jgi:hypothetical protein
MGLVAIEKVLQNLSLYVLKRGIYSVVRLQDTAGVPLIYCCATTRT